MALVDKSSDVSVSIEPLQSNPNLLRTIVSDSTGLFTTGNNGETFYHWSTALPTLVLGNNLDTYSSNAYEPTQPGINKTTAGADPAASSKPVQFDKLDVGDGSNEDNSFLDTQRLGTWGKTYTATNWVSNFGESFAYIHVDKPSGVHFTQLFNNPSASGSITVRFNHGISLQDGNAEWEDSNCCVFLYQTGSALSGFQFAGSRRSLQNPFTNYIGLGETMYCTMVGIDGDFSSGTDTNYFIKTASWTYETGARDDGLAEQPAHSRAVALRHTRLRSAEKIKLRTRIK